MHGTVFPTLLLLVAVATTVTASPAPKIVNGQEANVGQFPHQVFLEVSFPLASYCGGSLISANYVLSAAHCFYYGMAFATGGTALLGAHNRAVSEASQQRIPYTAADIKVHPNFVPQGTLRYDIATVRLSRAAVLGPRVQLVALPARSDTRAFDGLTGYISGFGSFEEYQATTSSILLYTSNPILSNVQCHSSWSPSVVEAQNLCLSGVNGRSGCSGDSGGPLTILENGGAHLQVAIASFVSGNGCAAGYPSVFARVSVHRDWIEANSDYRFRA